MTRDEYIKEGNKMTVKRLLMFAGVFLLSFGATKLIVNHNPTDTTKNTVMITNKAGNSGGTGVIYKSTKDGSLVLTNAHVCGVVENGGLVRTTEGQYQVQSFLKSQISDLCMIFVSSDLKENTKLAKKESKVFDSVKVSGHPALLPTVMTYGHFSDRQIITVMTGTRPCTATDAEDPLNNLYCGFFGVVPVLKSYESQLVTATIMPGSSGSGVYNKNNELAGLIFAGSGDFGYGWIVTYDQVAQFLNFESHYSKFTLVDQTLNAETKKNVETKEMVKKCVNAVDPNVLNICRVLKRDMVWNK